MSSQAQNVQRGIVFMTFITVLFFIIAITIRLIKKLIDPNGGEEQQGDKYKEGEAKDQAGQKDKEAPKPKPKPVNAGVEESTVDFDTLAKKPQEIKEDDPPGIKMVKKNQDFHVFFFPLMITLPLNIVTGTAFSFVLVLYFAVIFCLIFFNVLQVHRKCGAEHKCVCVILENLGLTLSFFFLLNQWGASPISQPYSIV